MTPQTTKKKKPRYRVWHAQLSSAGMPDDQASYTISGLKTATLYERESLAANIERFLNSLRKSKFGENEKDYVNAGGMSYNKFFGGEQP